MNVPKQLSVWDFPERTEEYIGWDYKTVPKFSEENFWFLIEKYNELVAYVTQDVEEVDDGL